MLDNPITRRMVAIAIGLAILNFLLMIFGTYVPNIAMPEEIRTSFAFVFEKIYQWNFLVPVGAMIWCFSVAIMVEIGIMFIKFALFVWRIIGKSD